MTFTVAGEARPGTGLGNRQTHAANGMRLPEVWNVGEMSPGVALRGCVHHVTQMTSAWLLLGPIKPGAPRRIKAASQSLFRWPRAADKG